MSIEEKEVKIIDLNLFSGSADTFRTAMGGYYEIVDVDTTDTSTEGQEVIYDAYAPDTESPFISRIYKDAWSVNREQLVDSNTIVPNVKYAVRCWGSQEGNIPDDTFWKTFWMGGSYADETYPAVYNETVWDNYWFQMELPYSQIEANTLVEKDNVSNKIQVSCEYNHHIPKYQEYVGNLSSELLIPNMYLIEMFNNGLDISATTDPEGLFSTEDTTITERVYDGDVQKFVSLEGLYDTTETDSELGNINELLADVETTWVAAPAEAATDTLPATAEGLPNYTLHHYLEQSVPLTTLSASTTSYIKNALQNVFFDQYSIYSDGTANPTFVNMESDKKIFPYYVNINFPARGPAKSLLPDSKFLFNYTDDGFKVPLETYANGGYSPTLYGYTTVFAESLANHNYSSKFLKTLKEVFNDEIDSLAPNAQEYALSQDYQTSSADSIVDDQATTVENTTLRSINYLELLMHSYNNYKSTTDNCYFVGEKLINREVAMDDSGAYRYLNSKNAMHAVEDTIKNLDKTYQSWPDMFDTSMGFDALLNGWRGEERGKYSETIAYKIEKIGGPGTGDSQTQNVLQNFWIFNSIHLGDINLLDSQVKYGQDYTYNVYAYVISAGVRHKFSNLRLTRQINYNEEEALSYCLEWYDPSTGETADSLTLYDHTDASDFTVDEASLGNTPTNSLVNTEFPAIAEFYANIEPSVQIFEIPIFSKTVKVLDNPPNQLSTEPFHVLDASQTIGYDMRYETFFKTLFPKPISSADEALRRDYLNVKDLLESDEVTEASISQQRYLEVYRLSKRPTSYINFDNNLISTIDLKMEDSTYTLPNTIFYDIVNTNQKYYYIFRVLNENLVPGHLSEIYEAELINDGGYTYSDFQILFEEDLEEDIFVNPSINFKKLLQLQPNISQITLNDENVVYTDTAIAQLENMTPGIADDLIWGKTFKIRLTSKKTGRKIDLNVTYKYETDSD